MNAVRSFCGRHRFALFLGRRLLLGALTLFAVSVLVFAATQALPGDPATAILGRTATPERIAALRAQLHLDDPLLSQYWQWVSGLLHGDLGISAASQEPVSSLLGQRVQNSLALLLAAGGVALPLSLLLGIVTAVRRDRLVDHVISSVTLALAALPDFVVGIVLVLLLSTSALHLFPPVSLVDPTSSVWHHPSILFLPALTLVLAVVPYVSRILRGSMIEVLESEYIQMARLKGLPERRVILRHAIPNAVGPAIQVSALQLVWLTGGVVVVEYLFQYRGIGMLLVEAVGDRDLPVIQAVTLLAAAVYVLLNIVAEIGIIATTPQLRTRFAGRADVAPPAATAAATEELAWQS
ncbi:ABC transporter permease [Nocardioides mesophilus]|uniref:ABC transporter permease n=1 Tax=Nocardioides mesophilus TaxID=433659 RepID=A0A7G9R9T7_9ACTN|nr:ABC transporter permease [Nocardioides mesophilus]QNN52362.1 ABC transporter permease [Nocardioides mesophilus]